METPDGYNDRRRTAFAAARRAIKADPAGFAEAAERLDTLYPEAEALERAGQPGAVPEPRLARLSIALRDAIADNTPGNNSHHRRFDFDTPDTPAERHQAARLFILTALLAGDELAHEAIAPASGVIVSLPWGGPDELGRGFVSWPADAADGWTNPNAPSPRILRRLGEAVALLPGNKATGRAGTMDRPRWLIPDSLPKEITEPVVESYREHAPHGDLWAMMALSEAAEGRILKIRREHEADPDAMDPALFARNVMYALRVARHEILKKCPAASVALFTIRLDRLVETTRATLDAMMSEPLDRIVRGNRLLPGPWVEAARLRNEADSEALMLLEHSNREAPTGGAEQGARASDLKHAKLPRRKPGGYTAGELREEADGISATTFRNIRKASGVDGPPSDTAGQYHNYSNTEIRKLADAAESGNFRNREAIAAAWRALIGEKPKGK